MRWPFKRRSEQRQSGGGYADAITAAIEAQASAQVADVSSTAAIEAAAGALSRAFMSAEVEGPSWVQEAVPPTWLAQVGRSLDSRGCEPERDRDGRRRHGRAGAGGLLEFRKYQSGCAGGRARIDLGSQGHDIRAIDVLHPAGLPRPAGVRPLGHLARHPVSWPGPDELGTHNRPAGLRSGAVPCGRGVRAAGATVGGASRRRRRWRRRSAQGAQGRYPRRPRPGVAGRNCRDSGWGEGKASAPQSDWKQSRLGPAMPPAMVELARDSFMRTLAACGVPPSLFTDADGTSQREAVRRWHLGTVLPLARMVEFELSAKLESPVKLRFDGYPKDMVSRAQVFAKLIAAEGMTVEKALEIAGLVDDE